MYPGLLSLIGLVESSSTFDQKIVSSNPDRALMNFILRNSIRNYHVITKDNIVRKPAA